MRYVIIGASAAGINAALTLRKLDSTAYINVLSSEKYDPYYRCLTSYLLAGKTSLEKMQMLSKLQLAESNIDFHPCTPALNIDLENQIVHTANKVFFYDKLLIASGASAVKPNVTWADAEGIAVLRTLDDVQKIRQFIAPGKTACIAGGGLVSLKAAYALCQAGMEVNVIISSKQVLSQILDNTAARFVEQILAQKITFYFQDEISDVVLADNKLRRVKLASGKEFDANILLYGKGVKPNLAFLPPKIEKNVGIVVSQYLSTNIPNVYAAGDVCETFDIALEKFRINALWPNAVEQGKIAAQNMISEKSVFYPGSISMNSASFWGQNIIAAGFAKATQSDAEVFEKSSQGKYRKFVWDGNVLKGYVLIGDTRKAGILTALIKTRKPISNRQKYVIMSY